MSGSRTNCKVPTLWPQAFRLASDFLARTRGGTVRRMEEPAVKLSPDTSQTALQGLSHLRTEVTRGSVGDSIARVSQSLGGSSVHVVPLHIGGASPPPQGLRGTTSGSSNDSSSPPDGSARP